MEFECANSANSNIKSRLKQNMKFWSETLKANKAIVNVFKRRIQASFIRSANTCSF